MITYDGVSANILNKGALPNPDSICIRQPGENSFVNADFLHTQDPKHWHPSTDSKDFNCQ